MFSLSTTKAFDLGMYKNGETREVKFDKPGIVRLGCNLHANMSAYLIVVDAPHYVVGRRRRRVLASSSLAPGKYKVQRVERAQRRADDSRARRSRPATTRSTLDVKGGAPAGPSANKFGTSRTAAR